MMEHGRHIKVVGLGNPDALRTVASVKGFLSDVASNLGMRSAGDAQVHGVAPEFQRLGVEPFSDEGGVAGVCLLAGSHCTIHTWPLRSFFVMDVYSSSDFDPAQLRKLVEDRLGAYQLRITDLSSSLQPDWEELPDDDFFELEAQA